MKSIILLIIGLFLSLNLYCQEKEKKNKLAGRVLDESGNISIPNVNIRSKSSERTTISDTDGNFVLNGLSQGDTIYFSHINYKDSYTVIGAGMPEFLVIKMKSKGIDLQDFDMVNTGFQKLPKERTTGSFSQINNKLYNEQVGTGVIERLSFITNGVSPIAGERIGVLANSRMLIRGLSTFTYSVQKPLIIVDNFEYQGSIDNLNPNDIESVTVLKDAAAGSIWGARAANGVIVITTKKGSVSSGIKISLNTNISIFEKPNLMNIPSISGSDMVDVEQFLFSQKYRFADTSRNTHPSFSPVYEILFARQSGTLSAMDAELQLNKLRRQDLRESYSKNFYSNAIAQQYAMSISGGNNSISWITSGGYDKNVSSLSAPYNRITFRHSSKVYLTKMLSLDLDMNFAKSSSGSGKPAYGSIKPATTALPSYSQFTDEMGNEMPLYLRYRQSYIDKTFGNKLMSWAYNPLSDYLLNTSNQSLQNINATFGLNYKIRPWLNIDVKYRYERQNVEAENYYDEQSYYTRDLVNSFSQINFSTGAVTYKIPQGSIIDNSTNILVGQNLRGQLNINKTWKENEVSFLAGSEIKEVINQSDINRTYGYRSSVLTFVNVDYANPYTNLIGGGTGFIPQPKTLSLTNNRFLSFYANGAYSLRRKYTISASLRRDASNLFGANINNKWKPLWSVGMAWDVGKEEFFANSWIDNLKIRGSYGVQGNIDPSQVAVATFNYRGTNPYTQRAYSVINNYPNPDLRWEQVQMLNLGIDFSAIQNRLSGSIEFYSKHLMDLFGNVPIDRTTGISSGSVKRNVGEAKGRGVDIQVKGLITTGKLRWTSDFIINSYKDKVTKLIDPPVLGSGAVTSGFLFLEGYTPSALLSYKWAGLDPNTGDPMGYLAGNISKDYNAIRNQTKLEDVIYSGSQLPTTFGSWGNDFSFKNIGLAFRMVYKFGYFFRKSSLNTSNLLQLNGHNDYAQRWQKPGDEQWTNVPSFLYPVNSSRDQFYTFSDILVKKGDHIRLQYINLNYTISKKTLPKIPFESIQLYAVVSNLGILWRANNENLDPDFPEIRSPQQYTFGLRIQL